MRRPWSARVWFYKPTSPMWDAWVSKPTIAERLRTLSPVSTGVDQFNWHTVVVGWNITGQIVVATKPCPLTGNCEPTDDEEAELIRPTEWPVDMYGHNHLYCRNPPCCTTCFCQERRP